MSLFSRELVNKRYLAKEELSLIARTGIEDLACSLFLWENGHYRFDSLESVGDYMVASVSLPSDAVTMEAMRRVDEWKRMKAVISPDSLFVPVKSNTPASPMGAETFSIMAPAEYLFSLVDGATSVEALCREVFFTEYRLYELLFDLWQKNRIMPLKMPRVPGKSPIRQKIPNSSPVAAGGIAFVIALCAALLMLGLGYVFNAKVLEKKALARQQAKSELHAYQSDNKLRIASLYYHAMFGRIPTDSRQLEEAGLIGPGDK
jgi:hypothetical protein